MTTPASPPELCPDCGRAPVAEGYSRSVSRCDNVYGDGQCQTLTIARLRAELTTLRQSSEHKARLTEAEPAEILLSRGMYALVDAADLRLVARFKWHARKSRDGYYAVRNINHERVGHQSQTMHEFLLAPPDGKVVDHENHNGLDNRRSNLRIATLSQNSQNMISPRLRRGKLKGVVVHRSQDGHRRVAQYQARIYAGEPDGKGFAGRISLGYFRTEIEAALAYDAAARERFGEFAQCNFPADASAESLLSLRAKEAPHG